MSPNISELQSLNKAAENLVFAASHTDHSDVGLEICQQKIARVFVESLVANGLCDAETISTLYRDCEKCCFTENAQEMSQESRKILQMASAISGYFHTHDSPKIQEIRSLLQRSCSW